MIGTLRSCGCLEASEVVAIWCGLSILAPMVVAELCHDCSYSVGGSGGQRCGYSSSVCSCWGCIGISITYTMVEAMVSIQHTIFHGSIVVFWVVRQCLLAGHLGWLCRVLGRPTHLPIHGMWVRVVRVSLQIQKLNIRSLLKIMQTWTDKYTQGW